jgi:predicted DCC family thiol-disulfide oxidoreductase YuxK
MKSVSFDSKNLSIPVMLLYDASELAMAKEVAFLKSKNADNTLEFLDLSKTPDIAAEYGVGAEGLGGEFKARDASGQMLTGLDALFAAHAAIGLGAWFEMCRVPGFMSKGTGIGPQG